MATAEEIERKRVRRRARAHAFRAEGLSYGQIAKRLECGKATVIRDLAEPAPELAVVSNIQRPDGAPVAGQRSDELGRATLHGALGPDSKYAGHARKFAPEILDAHPHLDEVRDGPALMRYGILLARLQRAYSWLGQQPDSVFADRFTGTPHPILERVERWEKQASGIEEQLAIAPLTRARLGLLHVEGRAKLRSPDYLRERYGHGLPEGPE